MWEPRETEVELAKLLDLMDLKPDLLVTGKVNAGLALVADRPENFLHFNRTQVTPKHTKTSMNADNAITAMVLAFIFRLLPERTFAVNGYSRLPLGPNADDASPGGEEGSPG